MSVLENEKEQKKNEKKNMDEVFKIASNDRASYSSDAKEYFKNYQHDLLDKMRELAMNGDSRLLIEISRNYLSDKYIVNIEKFRTDSLSDINIAAARIMKYKTEGKIDHVLAENLLADLVKRAEFITAGEVSDTIDKIKLLKDEL